jgi:hypothetical protein
MSVMVGRVVVPDLARLTDRLSCAGKGNMVIFGFCLALIFVLLV